MRYLFLITLLFVLSCAKQPVQQTTTLPASIVPYYVSDIGPEFEDLITDKKTSTVRVGMLLPLTGQSASIGENFRNSAMLAQFDLAGEDYILQFYDTKGTADGVKEAYQQAITDGVELILGPIFSKEVEALSDIYFRKEVPIISFTSDPQNLGSGIYSLALMIPDQVERNIWYACATGRQNLAIMVPDTLAGDLAVSSAKTYAKKCGMNVLKPIYYNPTFINFEPYVLSLLPEHFKDKTTPTPAPKSSEIQDDQIVPETTIPTAEQLDFDALLLADDGVRLKSISSLFNIYDVDARTVLMMGLSTLSDPNMTIETSLKNFYFSSLPSTGFNKFSKKYKEVYKKEPIRLSTLAYDAVALSLIVLKDGKVDYELLLNPNGFNGIDGAFKFLPNGQNQRLLGITKIVGPHKYRRIDKPFDLFMTEDEKDYQLYLIYEHYLQKRLEEEALKNQQIPPSETQTQDQLVQQ